MRVLCVGGAGFLGSHIVDLLQDKYDVRVADNFYTGKESNLSSFTGKISWVDITELPSEENKGGIQGLVESFKPDVIIHLAAQPSLLKSINDPIFDAQTNIIGTLNLIQAAKKWNVKRFIFASTSAILDNHLPGVTNPSSPYGISKLAAEYYISTLLPDRSIILRLANVYGPRQVPLGENQLIPRAIRHLLHGDDFEVYGDGTQTRDYIYVKDVARAFLAAVECEPLVQCIGHYWVSYGKSYSVKDVLVRIMEARNDGLFFHWKYGAERDKRQNIEINNQHFVNAFHWRPRVNLSEGIEKTFSWWKNNA